MKDRFGATEPRSGYTVTLLCLPCFLFPIAIAKLAWTFAYDSLPSDADFSLWPLYVIDSLFWADVCFTGILIWLSRGWRLYTAVLAIPLLCAAAMLTYFGGLWVSGDYF
jgi:hypothetical protein